MKRSVLKWTSHTVLIVGVIFTLAVVAFYFSPLSTISPLASNVQVYESTSQVAAPIMVPQGLVVTHLKTPEPLKAIYMSSWVAGNEKLRDALVKFMDESEINAVVIDIKDYTGKISFEVENPKLKEYNSVERRIPDVKEFIDTLHKKNIYVIGRISSFQDSYLVKTHPQYAVKDKAGAVWKDRKGVSWLDAGAKPVWDYLDLIGDEAYSVGFDELNFDYIRFPSDGDMVDIAYPFSQGKVKSEVMREFFAHVGDTFRPKKIPVSADLFGMTTSNKDDLGIGQILENALAHFDYVAPMVYPSHYPANFDGMKNPSAEPYNLIKFVMTKGAERAVLASTTPAKLRPWLQDFSINGTHYTPEMVRAQITATNDIGLTSWMMWNASNRYSESAYLAALGALTSTTSPQTLHN